MKNKFFFSLLAILFIGCQEAKIEKNPIALLDNNLVTHYTGTANSNVIVFDQNFDAPILSYKIYSSGDNPKYDPITWKLKGSNDGKQWDILDTQSDVRFCSRYQEVLCSVAQPSTYAQYMLEISAANGDTLKLADVVFHTEDLLKNWKNFKYPKVNFQRENTETAGDSIYHLLVQNPDAYVQYHTQKVAEILYFSDKDEINDIQQINYTLRDYDGVSSKGGQPPVITIQYSTQHVEKSAKESLYKLDFETRGVLYHELTHGYQYEPKGVGNYGNNKIFWSCIEGTADAVRAEAGLFDMNTRKPGGNWMDGYRTTGFFIQWMTTKDKDAIRKFHRTAKELEVWSWDGAIKSVFGEEYSIESLWQEYQDFLNQ